MLSNITTLFVLLFLLALPSAVITLLGFLFIPALRRYARARRRNAALVIFSIAILTSYAMSLGASVLLVRLNDSQSQGYDIPERNNALWELLWRQIVPPPFRRDCYSAQLDVCKAADFITLLSKQPSGYPPPPFIDPHLEAMTPEQYHAFQQEHDLSDRNATLLDYFLVTLLFLVPSLLGSAVVTLIFNYDGSQTLTALPASPNP